VPETTVTGAAAAAVYYPASGGHPSGFLFNAGAQTAYLGGDSAVSSASGFALPAGSRANLVNAAGTVWAVAGGNQQSPYGTANAAITQAGTTVTVASGGTFFTAGMTVVVDAGTPRQEVTSVASSNAGTVTVSPAFTFGHANATVFSQWAPYATTVATVAGAQ
jgi:hypothetical protein